ncbi:MAG: CoxG family protein [Candidatus Limnocylindrales bacterium]
MRIHGARTLDAPREAVFDAICDPGTLLGVIPGCRAIEQAGDTYRGEIALRLPGIVGRFRTTVRLVDAERPRSGRLLGEVVGRPGTIRGWATFRLAETGGRTTVEYDGQAELGGPLARLDSRFAEGLASSLIGQGLGNLDAQIRRERAADAERPATDAERPAATTDAERPVAATERPVAATGRAPR